VGGNFTISRYEDFHRIIKKEGIVNKCWCRLVLAILVIVFAWWNVSWANIALTVIGVLLAITAITGSCYCCGSKEEQKEESKE
jgi:hypothetical protein